MSIFKADNIPQSMKERRQWVPVSGKRCFMKNWNDSGRQMDFAAAREKSRPYPGFVIRDGVFCLDFDKVLLENGEKSAGFVEILHKIREKAGTTYVEKSQSGRGYHAFYTAAIPPDFPDTLKIPLEGGGVMEVYTAGRGRYIAITGNIAGHTTELADGTALLPFLLELANKKTAARKSTTNGGSADPRPCYLSVDEILDKIRNSASGELFKKLFDDGDTSDYNGDNSAADIALMNLLPFWCGGNADIMKQVFSLSALGQRNKWQKRADYRERTIKRALKDWNGLCYDPEHGRTSPDDDFKDLDSDPDIITRPQWPVLDYSRKKPVPIKQSWENTAYLLKELSISCCYNMLTKDVEFTGHELEGLTLEAAGTVIRGIMYKNGLRISRADLMDNIGTIAEKNRYSPVQDYLQACSVLWDGQDHIKEFFQHLHINPAMQENSEFYEALFRRWLIGAVRIAFNDGSFSMQGVLVLQGPQGIGKTRSLYKLLPDPAWGADGISLDPAIKDDVLKVMRLWICELGELGETLRKEKLDRLKAFFTAQSDDLRRPYRRTTEKIPRTTAFIGSVNGTGFLKDSSGERRYWCIPLVAIDDMPDYDPLQLWAQTMHLAFEEKERHWLTSAEIELLNTSNEPFKKITDEEQALLDKLDWKAPLDKWTARTSSEISEELGLRGGRLVMIGRAINNLARKDTRIKLPTNRHGGRKYFLPPFDDGSIFS